MRDEEWRSLLRQLAEGDIVAGERIAYEIRKEGTQTRWGRDGQETLLRQYVEFIAKNADPLFAALELDESDSRRRAIVMALLGIPFGRGQVIPKNLGGDYSLGKVNFRLYKSGEQPGGLIRWYTRCPACQRYIGSGRLRQHAVVHKETR